MTPEEARERFIAARVARLATADAAGRPHLVPIVFAIEGDRVYSVVDAKPKRTGALRRLANVRENPAVAVLVDFCLACLPCLLGSRAHTRLVAAHHRDFGALARQLDRRGTADPASRSRQHHQRHGLGL